jgi:aminopeptidase
VSDSFETKLEKYADLAVRVGVGLQSGQRLIVRAPVETAPFARLLVKKAYQAGARLVEVLWVDDATNLARFQHAPADSFDELPTSLADALLRCGERGDAVITVYATDPSLLKDQDPELVAKTQKDMQVYLLPFSKRIVSKKLNWCVVSAPIPSWAAHVFPDAAPEEGADRLWDRIFRICRIDQADPFRAWKDHIAGLARRREYLDQRQFSALRFRGPGTDLTVGLPERHLWLGGESKTAGTKIPFVANLPTEEVFTAPHRDRVDGVVRSTKPLSYAGAVIESFGFRFDKGRVVHVEAERNAAVLRQLIDTDDGAARLGEVALVPHSSPISQSGILFYNTLLDENASCHLAVGKSYRVCIAGGGEMSDQDYARAGGNESLVHVDFMIGSGEMDVDGVDSDGSTQALMRSGEWVD